LGSDHIPSSFATRTIDVGDNRTTAQRVICQSRGYTGFVIGVREDTKNVRFEQRSPLFGWDWNGQLSAPDSAGNDQNQRDLIKAKGQRR
jgi:hypothetical protein